MTEAELAAIVAAAAAINVRRTGAPAAPGSPGSRWDATERVAGRAEVGDARRVAGAPSRWSMSGRLRG